MERRSSEHEPIDQRHRQTHRRRPAATVRTRRLELGAVQVDHVSHARVQHRYDERLSAVEEPEVARQPLVEDGLNCFPFVRRRVAGSGGRGCAGLKRRS